MSNLDGAPEGPQPCAAELTLTVFDNGPDGCDWVDRAIADGVLTRERTLVGLCKDDVDRLTRSKFANCTLLVRFRSSEADGRMVMTANDLVALAQSEDHSRAKPGFGYDEIRDIFPLRSADKPLPQAQVV